MELNQSPTINHSPNKILIDHLNEDKRYQKGVNWFFWISGLSIVNTITFLLGWDHSFYVGLGVTQLIDAIAADVINEFGSGYEGIRVIAFFMDLFIAGVFFVCGILGKKHKYWAIIAGMILYGLDGILLFFIQAYVVGGFHLLALFGISSALRAYFDTKKILNRNSNFDQTSHIDDDFHYRPSQ